MNDSHGGTSDGCSSFLYVSSATRMFSDEDLVTYLRSWRDRNQQLDITGFLLYHDGNFIQALEGPSANVAKLVSDIRVDTRHRSMTVLWDKSVGKREFPEWCMGFRRVAGLSTDDQRTFSTLLLDPSQVERFRNHPGPSHRMLAQFKQVCIRQF